MVVNGVPAAIGGSPRAGVCVTRLHDQTAGGLVGLGPPPPPPPFAMALAVLVTLKAAPLPALKVAVDVAFLVAVG